MRLDEPEMRRRVAAARVARVGTVDERGRVHLVPVVFAIDGDTFYSLSDADAQRAKRLRNLERDPRVSVLVDEYDEDWAGVWWVRMRGTGRTIDGGEEWERAKQLLWKKYPQYEDAPEEEGAGPVMAVEVERWQGWAYSS